MKKIKKNKSGFTLIEMVLVIAIIVILAIVLYLNVVEYMVKAKSATSMMEAHKNKIDEATAVIADNSP
ncbi:MAG: prepilin-type N-terminal cleavage/methylation domain-containing protein [Clostridiales bacterium]|nr:prepilin-type N-terminal cleavage/methylation domain-containing protein [Clostridiales bacterium]